MSPDPGFYQIKDSLATTQLLLKGDINNNTEMWVSSLALLLAHVPISGMSLPHMVNLHALITCFHQTAHSHS